MGPPTFPQDSTGRTALHVSISCKQPQCSDFLLQHPKIDLTLRDNQGRTPFATALAAKDNRAGQGILQKEPKAAEQVCPVFACFLSESGDVCVLLYIYNCVTGSAKTEHFAQMQFLQ